MVDLLVALVAVAVSTLVPLYIGVFAPKFLNPRSERMIGALTAAALGILFWFYLDVMLDTVSLGQNELLTNPSLRPVLLVASFAVCLLVLFWLEGVLDRRFPRASGHGPITSVMKGMTFAIAMLVALGMGFHAIGEGDAIGHLLPSYPSIISAIGGFSGGIAYVLHKLLEGYVVGTVALLASATTTKRLSILGAIAGIPTLIGFGLGISIAPDSSYFFALSGASIVYASFKLTPRIATLTLDAPYLTAGATLLGFYSMYAAGLLHTTG